MILVAYTILHVVISLVAILSGFVVVFGMMANRRKDRCTVFFLRMTALTSITGFFFPVHHLLPSHVVGLISLAALAVAYVARYRKGLAGGWRAAYVITAVLSLYLNVFVLVFQLFLKVPALKALAPTQSEPPFKIAQLAVLVFLAILGAVAARRFHPETAPAAKPA